MPRNTKGQSKGMDWLKERASYQGDECLLWPFAKKDGYGQMKLGGKVLYAHRVICEWVNGPAPTPKHEASHSCGNGNIGCTTPKHLSWKTRSENQKDRKRHGTGNNGGVGKLSFAEADQIRALDGVITHDEIAKIFGVTRQNVWLIIKNQRWVRATRTKIIKAHHPELLP